MQQNQNRLWNLAVATASYALLLRLAALLLPNPNHLRLKTVGRATELVPRAGFHISLLGALLVGVLMVALLAGLRTWLTRRISVTGFNWPSLAGSVLAVLLVLFVANGILDHGTFFIHGVIGWLATPTLVWFGTFVYERIEAGLVRYAQKTTHTIQGHASAILGALPSD